MARSSFRLFGASAGAEAPKRAVTTAADAPEAGAPNGVSDAFLHQLRFEHLRSVTALSVSATGGGLVALQAGLFEFTPLIYLPLACFALTAILSLMTQRQMVDELHRNRTVGRTVRVMAQAAEGLFGFAFGTATVILLLA